MKKLIALTVLGASVALSGCGGGDESAEAEPQAEETLDPGTSAADMSPTLEGSGDMSSAAGAGATTEAMDGGRAGEDGDPAEGAGGPNDAMTGEGDPAPTR